MSNIDRVITSLKLLYLKLELQRPDPGMLNNLSARRLFIHARMQSNQSLQFVVGRNIENELNVTLTENGSELKLKVEFAGLTNPIDVLLNERENEPEPRENTVEDFINNWIDEDRVCLLDLWNAIQNGRVPNGLRRILDKGDK